MQKRKQRHLGLGVLWFVSMACGGAVSVEESSNNVEVSCREDSACGAGHICEEEVCKPGCREEAETCGAGYVCVDGACKLGCREEAETCGAGYVCVDGACKPGCREDADCVSGYLCEGGLCKPGCHEDTHCGDGYVCKKAGSGLLGVCAPGCNNAKPCEEGYVCEGAEEGVPGTCRLGCYLGDDDSCDDENHICVPKEAEISDFLGVCRLGCRVDLNNNTCGGNGYVCAGDEGSTQTDAGTCRVGCRNSHDCPGVPGEPGNQVCIGYNTAPETLGMCRPGCRKDEDCPGAKNTDGNEICIGYEAQPEKPGSCQVGCRIHTENNNTTDSCAPGHACRGETNQTNSTGTCQTGWCRVGSALHTCADTHVCVGYGASTQPGAPGICRSKCLANNTCPSTNETCVGNICRLRCTGANDNARDTFCKGNIEDEICGPSTDRTCRPGCRTDAHCPLPGQRCLNDVCQNTP